MEKNREREAEIKKAREMKRLFAELERREEDLIEEEISRHEFENDFREKHSNREIWWERGAIPSSFFIGVLVNFTIMFNTEIWNLKYINIKNGNLKLVIFTI